MFAENVMLQDFFSSFFFLENSFHCANTCPRFQSQIHCLMDAESAPLRAVKVPDDIINNVTDDVINEVNDAQPLPQQIQN